VHYPFFGGEGFLMSRIYRKQRISHFVSCAVLAACAVRGFAATKDNNAISLDQAGSWVGSLAPSVSTLAIWDSTVTTPLSAAVNANVSWLGIVIVNPGGTQTISYDNASHGITLGASGIDMTVGTQHLIIYSRLSLAANQTWNVQTNRLLLAVPNGGLTLNSSRLTIVGGGTVFLALAANNNSSGITMSGSGTLELDGSASQYSGLTILNSGTLSTSGGLSGNSDVLINDGVLLISADDTAHSLNGRGGTITTSGGSRTLTLNQSTTSTTAFYQGLIAGNLHLSLVAGTQRLGGTANTYTGTTSANGGTLGLRSLADGGLPSSIGQSSAAASNLILTGGVQLFYDGDLPGSTDRLFTVGSGASGTRSATIRWSRAPIHFTNTGAISYFDASSSLTLSAPSHSYESSFAPLLTGGRPLNVAAGIWKLANTNNSYTGPTIIAGTVVVDSLSNGLLPSPIGASSNAAANLVMNGGELKYTGTGHSTDRLFSGSLPTISASGTGPVSFTNTGALSLGAAGTLTLAGTNAGDNLFAPTLSGTTSEIIKWGLGKWVLTGSHTYGGPTSVFGGVLVLDFSVSGPSSIVSATSQLSLGGGELQIKGKAGQAINQEFAGLAFGTGRSSISVVQNGATAITINLKALTRDGAGNAIDFNPPAVGSLKTTTLNEAGDILGGWATANSGMDWATVDAGNIVPFAGYTANDWSATANTTTTVSATQNGATTNSLRFNSAAPVTLTLSGVNTVTSGGILVTSNVGANDTAITGGTLRAATGKEIVIHQNNTSAALTISSTLADNGKTNFTKTGYGLVVLGARNTYTGITSVVGGTLRLGAPGALPFTSLFLQGTLDLNGFDASVWTLAAFGFGGQGVITNSSPTPATFTINTTTSTLYFWGTISGNINLRKDSDDELMLFNRQHYTGDTIVAGGNLTLNGILLTSNTDVGNNVIPTSSRLIFEGGTLGLAGAGAINQTSDNAFARLGDSTIISFQNFPTGPHMQITALTRNRGATLRFRASNSPDGISGIFVDSYEGAPIVNGGSGIIGGWALAGTAATPTEFASVYPALSNAIAGGATYAGFFDGPTRNTNVQGTLTADNNASTGSIRFVSSSTLTLQGHNVVASGGILAVSGSTPRIFGAAGSDLTSGVPELFIHSYQSAEFLVNAVIVDNPMLPNILTLVKGGTGTVTLNSSNTYTGATYINGGVLQIGANNQLHDFTGKGALLVKPNVTLTADSVTPPTLTINGTLKVRSGGNHPIATTALTIARTGSGTSSNFTGTIELADNPLLLQTTSTADKNTKITLLSNALFVGRHGGDWLGKGITSATVAADQSATGSQATSLALFDNAILNLTTFAGQTVDSSSLLVMTAIVGDTNFDHIVDIVDLVAVTSRWQTAQVGWNNGDINFDGIVNVADFNLVASHWQQTDGVAAMAFPEGLLPQLLHAVPEPSTLVMGLPALWALVSRRRSGERKRHRD
jgi:fibronectin-binding autotransporter adhesin